ncbi:hypothetical protein vseg_019880 [Gypsophila vaccaria]
MSSMLKLSKSLTLIKTLNPHSLKPLSTASLPHPPPSPPPPSPPPPSTLPPNPSSGSPPFLQNWRSPSTTAAAAASSLVPLRRAPPSSSPSKTMAEMLNSFAENAASQHWTEIKDSFERWISSLDSSGRPNRPNVELFNLYLRADLMCGANGTELLQVVDQMELYAVVPNTASFNLVLKALKPSHWPSAVSVLERMLQNGKQSQPDDESFNLVIGMLFQKNQIEAAFKYVDVSLKSGCMLSPKVFGDCVRICVSEQRLDTLVSVIEKCKVMDQNKALLPNWNLCNTIAEIATRNDNSKLAFMALGFMARWMLRGENDRSPVYLSVNEGLVVKALSASARTCDSPLLDASWSILKRSLREKKAPNPETYLAKINALASLGNLPSAFSTLSELEKKHNNSTTRPEEHLLSPFTSLHPLVVACTRKGHETLDLVYFQLENLSRADPPYKSVAALNCVILGCANIWDLDRAYQTFEAINSSFGLTPNIHSYNALMNAFGKLRKTQEAAGVFEHLSSVGVKPNAMSYSLLVDAHLINRDVKSALAVLEAMIEAGFKPQRQTLLNVRRRCLRELDNESNDLVESIAKQFKIVLGSENRRNFLFNMDHSTEYTMDHSTE